MIACESVRLDKWLWAVRVYKTRSQASEACRAGHVIIGGHPAKPAREVHPGEIIQARAGDVARTLKVLALLQQRVGAGAVTQYLEDLTSPAEYQKVREQQHQPFLFRSKGSGRPTKKERRNLTHLFQSHL